MTLEELQGRMEEGVVTKPDRMPREQFIKYASRVIEDAPDETILFMYDLIVSMSDCEIDAAARLIFAKRDEIVQ